MFKPQKHVLIKKNSIKTMFLFICFLPSKNRGFALRHLQASFHVLNMFNNHEGGPIYQSK
jgi:hypothetical protein